MNRRGEEQDDEERQQLAGSGRVAAVESNAWPTVDGPLGLSGEESVACARRFFRWGFALLPFLWAVNCFYFWPVLRNRDPSPPSYFNRIRPLICKEQQLAMGASSRAIVKAMTMNKNNNSNDEPRETIMLPDCDYNHWPIVIEFPNDPALMREQIMETTQYARRCTSEMLCAQQ